MNILSSINQIILAKLLPSQYRKYWKIWNEKFRNRYNDVFGTDEKGKPRYRLYIPIDNLTFINANIDGTEYSDYILILSYIIRSVRLGYNDFKDNFLYNILSTKYELSDDWDIVANDILYISRNCK